VYFYINLPSTLKKLLAKAMLDNAALNRLKPAVRRALVTRL